jgi:hypothetical protein
VPIRERFLPCCELPLVVLALTDETFPLFSAITSASRSWHSTATSRRCRC